MRPAPLSRTAEEKPLNILRFDNTFLANQIAEEKNIKILVCCQIYLKSVKTHISQKEPLTFKDVIREIARKYLRRKQK